MIKYNYAPKTAIGGRKENQDTEGSCVTKFGFLSIVCDGMGGAAGGKTASTMAVNIIMQEVLNSQSNMPAHALMMAIKKANQEIYNRGRQQTELRGMGTTATALIINEEKVTIAHAGDSRVYQLRDGEKVFRTNDHSKVFELVKRGILSEEQARLSEESNIIQRALGIAPDIEVEINDNIPFLKGDIFMLCTDGVCGALPEEDLLQLLKKEKDIKQLSERVIRQIDLLGNQHGGGHDNLTLAFVKPLSNSKLDVIIDMKTKITIYSLAAMVALLAFTIGYLLFSDNSKIQIAQLQADVKTLKDSLQRFSTSGNPATQPVTDSNAHHGSDNSSNTTDGEDISLQTIAEKEKADKEKREKADKEKSEAKRKESSKLPYDVAKEITYTVPNNSDKRMKEKISIGKMILIDNGIDTTNADNLSKLILVNGHHIPKIDWNNLPPGFTFKVYLPKLDK
jgi:serine/threonine protein phosphatase PrpC